MFSRRWDVAAVVGVALVALSVVVGPSTEDRLMYLVPLTYVGLCLMVIGAAGSRGPVHGFLTWRPIVLLGMWSYSIYLTHFQIATVLEKVGPWDRLATMAAPIRYAALLAVLAFVVLVGYLMYRLVEEPARKLITRRLLGKPRTTTAPRHHPDTPTTAGGHP